MAKQRTGEGHVSNLQVAGQVKANRCTIVEFHGCTIVEFQGCTIVEFMVWRVIEFQVRGP